MSRLSFWSSWSRYDYVINFSKLFILFYVAVLTFSPFSPWYTGSDSVVYGLTGIQLSHGYYDYTNELLEKTGRPEFVPNQWVPTVHNSAIPLSPPGFPAIIAISLLIAGDYALLFLPTFLLVLFFIISDRIATKLFGKTVGFLTITMMATNTFIISNGGDLLTESTFSIFFLTGFYFLILSLKNPNKKNLFLTSVFFSLSCLIRGNGIIAFPIELSLLIGTFILKPQLFNRIKIKSSRYYAFLILKTSNFKKITYVLFPWFLIILFWLFFNNYYFGDPLTNYYSFTPGGEKYLSENLDDSFFSFYNLNEETINNYSKYLRVLTPDFFKNLCYDLSIVGCYSIMYVLITNTILISAIILSFRFHSQRSVIVGSVYTIIIFVGFLGSNFFSAQDGRFMIPILPIMYMITSFCILYFFYTFLIKKYLLIKTKKYSREIIFSLLIFLILSSMMIILESPFSHRFEKFISGKVKYHPLEYYDRIKDGSQGMSSDGILVKIRGSSAVHFDVIPFNAFYDVNIREAYSNEQPPTEINPDTLTLLKNAMNDGYPVYVKKIHRNHILFDESFKKLSVEKYNMHMKDFSRSFCTMELNQFGLDNSTDDACIMHSFWNKTET